MPILLIVLLLAPAVPVEAFLSPVQPAGKTPVADPNEVDARLLEAYRLARLRPDVRTLLEHHAAERGWIVPEPALRTVAAADLPAAIDAFGATFGASPALTALRADIGHLPTDLARALALLLYALVDAQGLQLTALAPLTLDEVRLLANPATDASVVATLARKANIPLTLQAAATLDAAVLATDATLKKWGALLRIGNLGGRPFTADAVAASLPDLAHAMSAGDPALVTIGWAEALLAHRHLLPASSFSPRHPLPETLALTYSAMGIPLDLEDVLTFAAMRGVDPKLSRAISLQIGAGLEAWRMLQAEPDDPAFAALAGMTPEVARIAAKDGATPADLALLEQYLAAAGDVATPGALEGLTLLVQAARESRALTAAGPLGPLAPANLNNPITVGELTVTLETHANGTNSVHFEAGSFQHRVWGRDLKMRWNTATCSLDVWRDVDGDGRMRGEAADGGERLLGTRATCDVANDVLFRDAFGYVLVTGEGSSTIDSRYGKVVSYTGRTGHSRSQAWNAWNDTMFGYEQDLPAAVGESGCANVPFFGFGFICFSSDGDKTTIPVPGIGDFTGFGCILQFFSPALAPACFHPGFAGRFLFGFYPGENLTINPDNYQILTLDLGGDDVYRSNAGGTLNSTVYEVRYETDATGNIRPVYRTRTPDEPYVKNRFRLPVALALDYGGNDRYENTRAFVQGAADMGVGFLYDDGGNDVYLADRYAQGSATTPGFAYATRAGTETIPVLFRGGALAGFIDLQGDDVHVATDFSQAFANSTSLAFVLDAHGKDRWEGRHQSQAFANGTLIPYEVGIVTNIENDREYNGLIVTVPVTVGSDRSVRFAAPPARTGGQGTALFIEAGGDDTYVSHARRDPGNVTSDWAQGRATYTGIALLLDLAGRDTGLATNGRAEADNLLALRFSGRSYANKNTEPKAGTSNTEVERHGSYGIGFALDVDVSDPAAYPGPRSGYVFETPGARFEQREDPFWKLHTYIDIPGAIALGHEGRTVWNRTYMLAIDLAGDDAYTNRAGSASLDADAYFDNYANVCPPHSFALAGTSFGGSASGSCPKLRRMGQTNLVGLTIDSGGRDTYTLPARSGGYGLLAIGMLYDRGLDPDRYDLARYSGGAALSLGVGVLHDEGGNDNYTAVRGGDARALGFGERGGFGLLVDAAGNDRYEAGRWSLGSAVATASFEAGFFFDASGSDRYRSPQPSQGVYLETNNTMTERQNPVSANATAARPGDSPLVNLGGVNVVAALFVDDGLAADVYDVIGGPCYTWQRPSNPRTFCRKDNAAWQQDYGEYTRKTGEPNPLERAVGRGFDNLDWFVNNEFRNVINLQVGNPSAFTLPLGPDVLAVRAVLLSPSVEFTSPTKDGDGAPPVDAQGNRRTSQDADPVAGVRNTTAFEVVARAAEPRSISRNALRLADFLLFEEAQRYTCSRVDPYRDPARHAGATGAELMNPLGGPHSPPPSYCVTIDNALTPVKGKVPFVSAYPVLLPVIEAAMNLALLDAPAPPEWDRAAFDAALVEAATLAARGGAENLEAAHRLLDDVLNGRSTTASTPGSLQSTIEVPPSSSRVPGSENVGRLEWILQEKVGGAYVDRLVATCLLSGSEHETGSCSFEAAYAAAGAVWFADASRGCRATAGWGCFEFDWNTRATKADGTLLFPDGNYELLVRAYYKQTPLCASAAAGGQVRQGCVSGTPAAPAETLAAERVSDNYGFYPGAARRLVFVDNLPRIYGALTTVSDFVPDDLEHGLVRFRGFVSEPVRFRAWVCEPGADCTNPKSFLPVFGVNFNHTETLCAATGVSVSPCYARLDSFHRVVEDKNGVSGPTRRWCFASDGTRVDCTVRDARAGPVPINFAWRPVEPIEGLYTLRVDLWDRTHPQDNSPTKNVQNSYTFTFWGDLTPPTAVLEPMPSSLTARELNATAGTVRFTLREDADAAAGRGSNLAKVIVERSEETLRYNSSTKALDLLPSVAKPTLTFLRAGGAVRADVPVSHGTRLTLKFTAVDSAGNVQPSPTVHVFQTDLSAPSIAPMVPPPRLRPDAGATITWPEPGRDAAFGPDLDRVEISWARGDAAGPKTAFQPVPASMIDVANRTFRLVPGALGITDAAEPDGIYVRAVAIDVRGNRERFDVATGKDLKLPDGPILFDTRGPVLAGGEVSRLPALDRATLQWAFDEAAPDAALRFVKIGPRTGAADECTTASNAAATRLATLTSPDGGVSWKAVLGTAAEPLESNAVYEFTITATDLVGNPATPVHRRFCTLPLADVAFTRPLEGATLTGPATLAFNVKNVEAPTGTGWTGLTLNYTAYVEIGGARHDLPALRCGGSLCFESTDGQRTRSFGFETKRLPDATDARIVLLVSNATVNPGVPLRFESAPFRIDNGAPTTTAAFRESPGAAAGSWFSAPVEVVLTPTDAVSPAGITTWVSTDNRTFKPATSMRFATDGLHVLYFNSTDAQGNREPVRSLRFGVDTSPASVSLSVAQGKSAVRHGRVLVEVVASDAPSGLASVKVRTGPNGPEETFGPERFAFGALLLNVDLPSGDGTRFVEAEAKDLAGNIVVLREEILVDGTAPALVSSSATDVGFTTAALRLATDEDSTAVVFLKRATDRAYQARFESNVPSNLHRVPVTNLFPGTEYTAKIVVVDALGNEATSTLAFRTRLDETAPTAPRGLVAKDRAEGFLVLEWHPAEDDVGVARYAVYRQRGADDTPQFLGTSPTTRFLDSNLTPGTSYTYRVRAEDAAGNAGPLSEVAKGRATTRPTLTLGAVSPETAGTGDTYRYTVVYRDLDGDRPAFVRVLVNGKAYEMRPVDGSSTDAREGITYVFETKLEETRLSTGMNRFRFEASDGTHVVASGVEGIGPMVVGEGRGNAATDVGAFSGLFATFRGVPAVGAVVLALAAVGVVLLRRRWDA